MEPGGQVTAYSLFLTPGYKTAKLSSLTGIDYSKGFVLKMLIPLIFTALIFFV